FVVVCIAMWLRVHARLYSTRWFLSLMVAMTPAGLLATLGGWYTAEIGRQPYVVYGLLRTADAVSPVAPQAVLGTFVVLATAYALFLTGFLALSGRAIQRGPSDEPLTVSGSLKRGTMSPAQGVYFTQQPAVEVGGET